jgi:hypothetical protein
LGSRDFSGLPKPKNAVGNVMFWQLPTQKLREINQLEMRFSGWEDAP